MFSLLAAVMLAQTPDVPPPPPPPMPAAEPVAAPPPASAAADAPTAAPAPGNAYAGRSRGWLLEEKKWLEDSRPVIAPHALIAGGGAALLFTAILSAVIRPGLGGVSPLPGEVLGTFAVGGGIGMVVGGILLFVAWGKAGQVDAELESVKDALRQVPDDGRGDPPEDRQPDQEDAPPPAMPPAMTPQVRLPPAPTINVVLAQF